MRWRKSFRQRRMQKQHGYSFPSSLPRRSKCPAPWRPKSPRVTQDGASERLGMVTATKELSQATAAFSMPGRWRTGRRRSPPRNDCAWSFPQSFHQPQPHRTQDDWPDSTPDVTCENRTCQATPDNRHTPSKQQVARSSQGAQVAATPGPVRWPPGTARTAAAPWVAEGGAIAELEVSPLAGHCGAARPWGVAGPSGPPGPSRSIGEPSRPDGSGRSGCTSRLR